MIRRIFQAVPSARKFTEGGENFQRGWNCPEGILRGGVYLKWEELSTEEFSMREWNFYMFFRSFFKNDQKLTKKQINFFN